MFVAEILFIFLGAAVLVFFMGQTTK